MSLVFWKSVLISPVVLGITLLLSTGVMAAPKSNEIGRSAPVSATARDLILNKASGAAPVKVAASETPAIKPESDSPDFASEIVKPSDWQYTALQSVAAKYDCNTNLNNKPVSQIEFARGLNTCLNKVEPLLAQQPTTVTAADLEVIKRLTQEYRAQLTEIDSRITSADKRVAQAQANQFSTTTKLKGEVVFNVSGLLSGGSSSNFTFSDRVRLLFESSFSGQDKLWTRLATGNQISLGSTFKSPSTTGAQVTETGASNNVGIDWLAYQFPVANTNVYVAAYQGIQGDYAPTYSVVDDVTGAGLSVSSFGESSPLYKIGGGTGVGATVPFADNGLKSLSLGYFAFNANKPSTNNGVFGNNNSLLAQLNFKLTPQIEGGLTYINSSHNGIDVFGGVGVTVGTPLANNTGGSGTTNANSYGAAISFKPSETVAFSGFLMTSNAKRNGDTQNIWSYGGAVALPNVDGKGSLAGFTVGAEPYVGGAGSTPIQFQGFYKYKVSDNIAITPALIYVTATDEFNNNSALIGVVRTTLTF